MTVAEVFDIARPFYEVEQLQGLLIHGRQKRLVHQREVIGVGGVFQLDLPVTGEAEAVLAPHFDRVAGTLLHEQVDPLLSRAEEIGEGLDVILEGGEDHAVVLLDTQADQRQFALVQAIGVAFRVRHTAQAAIQGIAPAVIRADKTVGLTLLVFAHRCATMAAAVEQHMHFFLAVAHDDHRLLADIGALVAAGLRDLTPVSDPDPGAVENLVQLLIEDLAVGVQRRVNAVMQDQIGRTGVERYGVYQVTHDHSSSALFADSKNSGCYFQDWPDLPGTGRCAALFQVSTGRLNRFSV